MVFLFESRREELVGSCLFMNIKKGIVGRSIKYDICIYEIVILRINNLRY